MSERPLKKFEQLLTAMPGVSIVCPVCNTVIDHWSSGTLYDQLNVHTSHGCEENCHQCDNWFQVLPNVQCDQSVKNIMQEIMRGKERPVIDMQELLDNKIQRGEPVVITQPQNVSAETKVALDKMNDHLVKKGAKVTVFDPHS